MSFGAVPTWFYVIAFIFAIGFIIIAEWNSRS
ncbi:hypothetical protein SAMN05877842_103196 [Ureibacillus acetophenoni]|uniref:Uncharacterized protein n=1 Tax=Ureibacillus acetophenoni TaxID=614649 RepID=A0A285U6V9_9BACL|nr:hypothetical protein SAMN05877842_103196 [Ureibacillus acetophenoni]